MDIDTPQQSTVVRFGWLSVGLWIAYTILGFFLGIVFHFPGDSEFYLFDRSAALVGFVFGAISGLVVATLQWNVLKSWLRSPWLWLALTAISWGLIHAINDGIALPPQRTFAVAAVIVAVAQYAVLRTLLSNSILWIPIATIAWFLGFQSGEWLYDGEDPGNLLLAGLVVSVITGLALHLLLIPVIQSPAPQNSDKASQPSPNLVSRSFFLVLAIVLLLGLIVLLFGVNPFVTEP